MSQYPDFMFGTSKKQGSASVFQADSRVDAESQQLLVLIPVVQYICILSLTRYGNDFYIASQYPSSIGLNLESSKIYYNTHSMISNCIDKLLLICVIGNELSPVWYALIRQPGCLTVCRGV